MKSSVDRTAHTIPVTYLAFRDIDRTEQNDESDVFTTSMVDFTANLYQVIFL